MARQNQLMPTISNVEPGGSAVLKCQLNKTYDSIRFKMTSADAGYLALTEAQRRALITNIGVEINGTNHMPFKDAGVLQAINSYYGRADNDGYFTLHFNRPELHDLIQQRQFGLGTVGLETLAVTFDIADTAPADLKIEARARKREGMEPGAIVKTRMFHFNTSGAGEIEIDNLLKGSPILAMHFYKAEDDVNKITSKLNDYAWVDRAVKADLANEQEDFGRTAQTGYTHVDFCLEGDYKQALSTRRATPEHPADDFRQIIDLGSGGAGWVLVEYVDNAVNGVLG